MLQNLIDKQKIFSMFKQHIGVKLLREIQILPELMLMLFKKSGIKLSS